jgi:mono/diheme cytochrome c family protein
MATDVTGAPHGEGDVAVRRIHVIALGALLVAAACGGGSSAAEPTSAPAKTTVVATLPPTATSPSATLPPASTPSAAPSASSAAAGKLALGKKVYETAGEVGCIDCHQASGRGGKTAAGDTAPDIRGATLAKVTDALTGGVAAMSFIKPTSAEIEAVVAYLEYLNGLP